jgi:nucleoside-diphosphate-sugar epimerase
MVLVTGGTGLVGAHLLLKLLQEGESIRATYRSIDSLQKTKNLFEIYNTQDLYEKIEWVEADILDIPALEIAFEQVEIVYHAAALISFDPKDEEKLRKTNIEGTANIVNLALDFGVKKLCFFSSIAAMGTPLASQNAVDETTEWISEQPHSDYAISKHGAEMEVWRAFQEGLDCIILNPGIIIGPGFWDSGSGPLFRLTSKQNSYYSIGTSGFISVLDVVQVAIQLMKSDVKGESFCLIEENYSYQEILYTIANAMNKKIPNQRLKPWMTTVAWRIDWLLSFFLNRKRILSKATAKSLHEKTTYLNHKIKNLGFEFQPILPYIKEVTLIYKSDAGLLSKID